MPSTLETLARGLPEALGQGWVIKAEPDELLVTCLWGTRFTISPANYSADDVRWVICPDGPATITLTIGDAPEPSITERISSSLRFLSWHLHTFKQHMPVGSA